VILPVMPVAAGSALAVMAGRDPAILFFAASDEGKKDARVGARA